MTLYGLPAKASTEEKEIGAGETELRFPITTSKETPAGKHQNLFCRVILTENGVPITHIVGQGGIIRADTPPPTRRKAEARASAA